MTKYEQAVERWEAREIETGPELADALAGFWIPYTYNSGRIQNESLTLDDTREIFERGSVTSYTGRLRTLLQIVDGREAADVFERAFAEGTVLDEFLLQSFQYALTQGTYPPELWQHGERPGEYKRHMYATFTSDIGAFPEDCEDEIRELLDELQGVGGKNTLILAAYFHAKFENIHPFACGNGRVGRLAMNYLLVRRGHPPLIVFADERDGYEEALRLWDLRQELAPMKDFLKAETARTWEMIGQGQY